MKMIAKSFLKGFLIITLLIAFKLPNAYSCEDKVVLYTIKGCPFCQNARKLLNSKKVEFNEVDVTNDKIMRKELVNMTGGRKTVPQLFINCQSMGGFNDMNALNKGGKLDKLLY